MSNGGDSRKAHSTDDQETSVIGNEPAVSSAPAANVAASMTPCALPGVLLNNRYLLVRQLNAGGFGTVHLAHDQQMHGRPVVVKIQIQQRVDDPWFERKFSEEVRALSLLDHPGVVVAFDSGRTPDGMPFLVMQYVEGATLRTAMPPEGMPLARAADILKQLGNALAAAHEKGIWHRDLKPENIMLQTSSTGEDRLRLIDFGIATVADVQSRYQTSTRVAGSALYMAPEQTMGQPTALTDIYAMGLIAYEMVTGRRPFPAENAMQMIAMQQMPVRVRPSDLRPSLPAAAEGLILQSIEIDPAKRPQNARAFGDRLHDALLGVQASFAAPPPPPPPFVSGPAAATVPPLPPSVKEPSVKEPAGKEKRGRKPVGLFIAGVAMLFALFSDWRNPKPRVKPVVETTGPTPAGPSEEAIELAYWNAVKDSTDPQLYREYLSKYPDGEFASLANAKIASLSKKGTAAPAPPGDDAATSAVKQVAKVLSAGSGKLAEVAAWDAINDSDDAKPYRDYLDKYPDGLFATAAKMKIASMEKSSQPVLDPSSPAYRRKLPPPRDALSLSGYNGPKEGEIHWKGRVGTNLGLAIQGGEVNVGEMTGDLPRVPVSVEITSGVGTITAVPAKKNQWDHLVVRNLSGKPMTSLTIRWKVN